jgi:small subunit ribosomal protein S14
MEAQYFLSKLPKDSSIVRIRNRSPINGKPRGVLRKYGIDRITFRE